jgi:hypothetical protein
VDALPVGFFCIHRGESTRDFHKFVDNNMSFIQTIERKFNTWKVIHASISFGNVSNDSFQQEDYHCLHRGSSSGIDGWQSMDMADRTSQCVV